ncbi:MAG: nicotinate-nucleotide--dimethylbenzimidazole phosphoribosyltransferase [Owenweeksia sp.]|nr:nicotinate-nucleotide--dimethylbenzimidazole phosphoribosyltransferase [Owenweeksia sp.]
MTTNEMSKAMRVGIKLMDREHKNDCNMVGIGDLGIGNTSSASALCAAIQDCDPEKYLLRSGCVEESYQHKLQVLRKALGKHPKTHDPLTLLTLFGGFEIAAMVGAMLRAAHLRMLILIDGFVSATALLIARQLSPAVTDYCVFCSSSDEPGHQRLLRDLNARPLLDLNLKLGEGSGISLAFPLCANAVSILQQEQF